MELFKRTLTSRFAHRLGKVQQESRFLGIGPGFKTPESLTVGSRTAGQSTRCQRNTYVPDAIVLWPRGLVAATVKR
jgi:hypothetical protein